MTMRQNAKKSAKGFTLLEILVVVAIIGVLAAMIVPNVIGQRDQANVDLAKASMASIASALDMYRLDNNKYPTTQQGLRALVEKPSDAKKWNPQGYMNKLPLDPWGNEYVYLSPGVDGPYDLLSMGADGEEGGEDFNADINYRDN